MTNYINIDSVFHALADPTRRAVIEALTQNPQSIKELAAPHQMALPSFMKHIKILEESRLIKSEKVGRVRTCRLEPDSLNVAQKWLKSRVSMWEYRLDALDAYLQDQEGEE